MSAKKKATTTGPQAPAPQSTVQETTAAQAPDNKPSEAATQVPGNSEETPAAQEPPAEQAPDTKPSDATRETPAAQETPAPDEKQPTPSGEVEYDEESFVAHILAEFFDAPVVEACQAKVLSAIRAGKLISIVDVHGANVLEIHQDSIYNDRNSVRSLSAQHGTNLKTIVNQPFLAKFPVK